jgi:hypothetical protein
MGGLSYRRIPGGYIVLEIRQNLSTRKHQFYVEPRSATRVTSYYSESNHEKIHCGYHIFHAQQSFTGAFIQFDAGLSNISGFKDRLFGHYQCQESLDEKG